MTAAGEDVDADSLTKSADKWGILKPDRARLEDLAAEKGWKLREEVTEPSESTIQEPSAPLSGKTRGGSEERYTAKQIGSMSPQEITALQKEHQGKSLLALIAEGAIVEK